MAGGQYSFAAGRQASAEHDGTFVWADATGATFRSSGTNQFLIRASGGVGIGTTNPTSLLTVAGGVSAASFTGDGSGLSNLNASLITSGTLNLARVPGLDASNVVNGSLADARLSGNVALRAGGNMFSSNQVILNGNVGIGVASPLASLQVSNSVPNVGVFVGNRSPFGWAAFETDYTTNAPNPNAHAFFAENGAAVFYVLPGGSGYFAGTLNVGSNLSASAFSGNGSSLTNLNASQITSGKLADTQLSTNVALLNSNQAFTGTNTFNNAVGISAANTLEFGVGVAKQLDAGKIGYERFSPDSRDIVGAGTNLAGRKIKFWADGGATFTGTCCALAFTPCSDRNMKENFAPVSRESVLDKVISLPISEWNFKTDTGTRHIGPMAQDFYSAFGLGTDDKHIATVDADGVALAAIQGLNQKVESGKQKAEIRVEALEQRLEQKETEITELKKELNELRELVKGINHN